MYFRIKIFINALLKYEINKMYAKLIIYVIYMIF